MSTLELVSHLTLWILVLFLVFLLLGTLRNLSLVQWRLEQLEATTPSRLGRSGLKVGKKAPDFNLPSIAGGEVGLQEFEGRSVLLVFTQGGCRPCHDIVPELNKLQNGQAQALVVFNGDLDGGRKWAAEASVRVPVLVQEQLALSKRYEVFATPFAFLIDEKGIIAAKGIVNSKQHIGFVLAGRKASRQDEHHSEESNQTETNSTHSHFSRAKEVNHD